MTEYLDTRDLLTELEELETREEDSRDPDYTDEERAEFALDEDERERLTVLQELRDEIGETTMRDGETMIPEDGFEDYARGLAEDIGAINDDAGWPAYHIDWEAAANELKMDYMQVSLDGTDYWVRAW